MESGYRLWDEILKTIGTLTTGPIIILCLVLLVRRGAKRMAEKRAEKK